jgi:hypothetical protein
MTAGLRNACLLGLVAALATACDKQTATAPTADTSTLDTAQADAKPETTPEATPADTAKPRDTVEPPETSPETTPSEVAAEAETPSPAGANCLELTDCLFDACAGKTGAEAGTCLATAAAGQCPEASSPAEADAATALGACMVNNQCKLGYMAGRYECQRTKCLAESTACAAQEYGTEKCYKITPCVYTCEDEETGYEDYGCTRGCYLKGAKEELQAFMDLRLCITDACYKSKGWTTEVTLKELITCGEQLPGSYCDVAGSKCTQFQ